jgi:glycosyltransferase involved in cell wall biosynthesis
MTVTPRVLIIIATDDIGGPGKGVLQMLQHAPAGAFDYVLCNFELKGRAAGQFVEEARRRQLNLSLLQQRAILDPGMVFQARRLIREHGINLIQTHGYKSNAIGFCLKRLCGLPWIGFAHGYIDEDGRSRVYNRIDRLALRGADRVVAVSGSMRELLVRHGVAEERIQVIHNAVDSLETAPARPAAEVRSGLGLGREQRIVGVVGRLSREKGQRVFLRALETVVRRLPGLTALVIGDGPDRGFLEEFSRRNGLAGHVLFLGYQERVADFYQLLELLVLPSLSEGLPNSVLEAMSFGIPVLATSVGGVPEVIRNGNGVMVPPDDPSSLANEMIKLLDDEERRRAIGEQGKRSLHPKFSPTGRVQQIVDLYRLLLANQAERAHAASRPW